MQIARIQNATIDQISQGIKIRFLSRKSVEICIVIKIDRPMPNRIPKKLNREVSVMRIERIAL